MTLPKLQAAEKSLLASILFTVFLLLLRRHYTGNHAYLFYYWNLFLAAIPLWLSRCIRKQHRFSLRAALLLLVWLLFFPNTAYLVTDIFHFHERPPVPLWFDLLIVVSAAWNGLLLFIVSLLQVERWLTRLTSLQHVPVAGTCIMRSPGHSLFCSACFWVLRSLP